MDVYCPRTVKKFAFVSILILGGILTHATGQVRWLETTHNFGAIDENGGNVSCEMAFINEGNEPVLITQVNVTCGCTTPMFNKNAIEPGDTGKIVLSYNPTGRPGRFEKKAMVSLSNSSTVHSLFIKGSVMGSPSTINDRYPSSFGPLRMRSDMVPFGEVTKGRSKSYFLEVYNASTDTIVPIWKNAPAFISVGNSDASLYPGDNKAYTFMLSSEKVKEYGLTIDSLILVPDSERHPESTYSIPVMVMVNEDFSRLTPGQLKDSPVIVLEKESVAFENVKNDLTDSESLKTITIHNRGNEPLVIRRIYSMDPYVEIVSFDNKIKQGKSGKLKIKVHPSKINNDRFDGRVTIISNDPINPVVPVRISGNIAE